MKLDKEQRRALNERLKSKRRGLPANKVQLEQQLKKRAQLASGRAKNIYKAMDRSDKLKRMVEAGAKAVVGSVAQGEGVADAKAKAKALEITDEHHAAALSLTEKENEPDKEE